MTVLINKHSFLKILILVMFSVYLHAGSEKEYVSVQVNNGRNCSVYFSDYDYFVCDPYEYKNRIWYLNSISLDYNELKRDRENHIYVDDYPHYKIDFIPSKQFKKIIHERTKNKLTNKIYYLVYSVKQFRYNEYSCYRNYDDYRKELLENGFVCIGEMKDNCLQFNISDKDMKFTEDYAEKIIDSSCRIGNEVKQLTGDVIIKKAYGPPNYGETPNVDTIEYYPVLQLYKPCTVNIENNESEVKEVQLIFLTDDLNMSNLDGQRVSVNGKIEMANSGHHHESYYIVISNQSQMTFLNRKNDLGK